MKSREIIRSIGKFSIPNFLVRGVSCNSKLIKPGFIFVAVKGNKLDGTLFIKEAVEKGAKLIVSESCNIFCCPGIACIKVPDARLALAKLASRFYNFPSRKIKVVGVTGTNGKTTVTYLIEKILKGQGRGAGIVGTINYRFKNTAIASKNTTPGAVELQSLLYKMLNQGIGYCLMEVSSHALDQDRVAGIDFHSAIFTNLTQDHLDYHKDMEEYFKAKAKLFKRLTPKSICVINNDDPYSKRLKKLTRARIVTYAIDNKADYTARNILLGVKNTEFNLSAPKINEQIRTRLIGKHNVYNVLSAIAWAKESGVPIRSIKTALKDFKLVPGRLEAVHSKRGFSVFVDYAHTEDALKNVITALRPLCAGRLIVLFGCGGERDKTKRPKMGRVVTELADYAIITSDNPRSEDPNKIIRDIKKGIRKRNFITIVNRKYAAKKAVSLARKGDLILLAGKGHEDYQVFKNRAVHFDDREEVKKCLG
jgi:UDP-N-acetylmuramoyl-L-alanyl-D-glutamate--2,6-diaminopimelate ligase